MISLRKILPICLLCCFSCGGSENSNQHKRVQSHDGMDSISVPVLTLKKGKQTVVKNLHFNHSVGGKPINEKTRIEMTYDERYLKIAFECRDNPRMNQNFYTDDNTPMFTQEVFEIFISNGEKPLEEYLEIQLNPNNALFLCKISNGYQSDGRFENNYIDTKTSGIRHQVIKDEKRDLWKGLLEIPLELLKYPHDASESTYRMNMFRIISNEDHSPEEKWRNNAGNSTFACWNSTLTSKPQFHKPDYFGFLILK